MDGKGHFHNAAYRMRENPDAEQSPALEAQSHTVAWLNFEKQPGQVSDTAKRRKNLKWEFPSS